MMKKMVMKRNSQIVRKKIFNNLPLYSIFQKIPARYDRLNRLMTWGLDKKWRERTVKECLSLKPKAILDLCTGTGDMALLLAEKSDYPVKITAVDFSNEMLKIARIKLSDRLGKDIELYCQNAANLKFKDETFDAVTVSFGFRNLTFRNPNASKHIGEILRVLKPGGICLIVESSQPENAIIRFFYHLYIRFIVKSFGTIISKYPPAYRYLANSMINYFSPDEMSALLIREGFKSVKPIRFLGGATALYIARKNIF